MTFAAATIMQIMPPADGFIGLIKRSFTIAEVTTSHYLSAVVGFETMVMKAKAELALQLRS